MKLLPSLLLMAGAEAIDLQKFLQIQSIYKQMTGTPDAATGADPVANSDGSFTASGKNLFSQLGQMNGFNPIDLIGAGGFDRKDAIASMKQNMINSMYEKLGSSTAAFNPLLIKYADETNNAALKQDLLYKGSVQEPMATILRLKKSGNANAQAYAKALIKKMMVSNMATEDPLLPKLLLNNDKAELKQYMLAKFMQNSNMDDFTRTILYKKLGPEGQVGTDTSSEIKELMKTKMLATNAGSDILPNDAYLMFRFLQMTGEKVNAAGPSDLSNIRLPADILLDIALGKDVAGIKGDEFKTRFGASSERFVCLAHEDKIRIPCMVNQETVTPDECSAIPGCCYNHRSSSDNSKLYSASYSQTYDNDAANPNKIPVCYHNLIGKVGTGIAKGLIEPDNIKKLFGSDEMPTLQDIYAAKDWAQTQLPESLKRLVYDKGSEGGLPLGQTSWWDGNYQGGKFLIHATAEPSAARQRQWKPHGPTALPAAAGTALPYADPTGEEMKSLNFVVGNYMDAIMNDLNSDSYTCKLIGKEQQANCFNSNYDLMKEGAQRAKELCAGAKCCFNEDNLFNDAPVCYRSIYSGVCDKETQEGIDFWTSSSAPEKISCGAPGVSKDECLLNPSCCYDANPRVPGSPWCYRRGASQISVDQQCELVNIADREPWFDQGSTTGKVLNKIVTESMCAQVGGCYDASAATAAAALGPLGDLNLAGPSCFKKRQEANPLSATYFSPEIYNPSQVEKVCANSAKWPKVTQNKWKYVNDAGVEVATTEDGRWKLSAAGDKTPVMREQCGDGTVDRHSCIYEHGCCFDKDSDPRVPWCYKSRYVLKAQP